MAKTKPFLAQQTLKLLRAGSGKTQQQMAEYLGISGNNYTQKENGWLEFSISECGKIMELFKKAFDGIFLTN